MRTRAIILKKQNTGEYDQLITCYTEEFGKVVAVAKSILKPNSIQAMHLDMFNLVDFELINGRAMPIITGAQAEETFPRLKSNLPSLAAIYFFVETINKLAFEHQKDEGLWNFLVLLLSDLNYHGHHVLHGAHGRGNFLRDKQIEFLDILGYAPNLNECALCTKRAESLIAYSTEIRGAVCKNCFLNGSGGIVVKSGDWLSTPVLNGIFESLVERKLYSLNLMNIVIK